MNRIIGTLNYDINFSSIDLFDSLNRGESNNVRYTYSKILESYKASNWIIMSTPPNPVQTLNCLKNT